MLLVHLICCFYIWYVACTFDMLLVHLICCLYIWYVACTFGMLLVHLVFCLYILCWKVKLFHRHCLKPCSKICHWESPVSSLRIQTEWENSRSHNVDEYTLSGNINTVKKNTVNILVHIEELGLEWNTGKYKCIFSFVKIIQKNYIPKGLCIS